MFFFSKSLFTAVVVAASLAMNAHAHAIVTPALGVTGTAARSDVTRPSTASPCGAGVNVAADFNTATAVAANGETFSATITNFNAYVSSAISHVPY